MTALSRIAALFVEPAPRSGRERSRHRATRPSCAAIGLLAPERHALAIGSAVALSLADATRSAYALVCCWPPTAWSHGAPKAPSFLAARRLGRSLDARGLEVSTAGRLVRAALPADPGGAVIAAERALAAASAPTVVVIAGPRPEELDELLLVQDAIVVAAEPEDDGGIVDLAVASFADRHPAVSPCAMPLGPLARALASAGLAAPLGARRPLAPVLEAVS